MGAAATIGLAVVSGLWEGYSARKQANAQAEVAEANAKVAQDNAMRLDEQSKQLATNNAINEENERAKLRQRNAAAQNAVNGSGVAMSGSALDVVADNDYAAAFQLAMNRYNGRQEVDAMQNNSTDYSNQANVYMQNARDYRAAGKRAALGAYIKSGLTIASALGGGSKTKTKTKTDNQWDLEAAHNNNPNTFIKTNRR